MRLASAAVRFYARAALLAGVLGALVLLLVKNRTHRAPLWLFGLTDPERPINVLWLMTVTAGITLFAAWAGRRARGLWREYGQLRPKRGRTEDVTVERIPRT